MALFLLYDILSVGKSILIHPDYVHSIDFEKFTNQWSKLRKKCKSFRTLQLKEGPSMDEALENFHRTSKEISIADSSYLFVIAIETMERNCQDINFNSKHISEPFEDQIPMLVILTRCKNNTIVTFFCKA